MKPTETTPASPIAIRARTREGADAGVQDCLALMTRGQWITGRSHIDVAARHGVSPDTVKAWATSASRIVRFAMEADVEDIRARMVSTLEGVIAEARTDGDHKAVVSAVDTQARLLGMMIQKHEVVMTEAEAEALVKRAALLAGSE